ncbi:MAG: non-canonical purine NTP pyrophosphatase, RdgB/HAM1 family [Gammaproteobacteria bacterium RIFCSPHIGHO2_12_FULL_41_15]|nr:MAG: non-canonical purine NTP pyrophosphatase, RdgB/HAM1 family [Gammaproteobacteria bacterium RIFCSPHIGHO2_12_FULL_41_15]
MLTMVLASTNPGKIREFTEVLQGLPIRLIPQSELNIPEVEETGSTFVENAIIKARHAAAFSGFPAIADDSGLMVDILNGEPGVRSSRYAGPNGDDHVRINKLLLALAQYDDKNRAASFYCVTVLMESDTDPAPLLCEGVWEGEILKEPRGTNGFGFDPVFYVPTHRCSAAELPSTVKNTISHRGQALAQLLEALKYPG